MSKKFFYLFMVITITSLSTLLNSCQEDVYLAENDDEITINTRADYDNGRFDWNDSRGIPIINQYGNTQYIPSPWQSGGTHSMGIPQRWKYDGTNDGFYQEEYGWELVYSNLNVWSNTNKYFALYNKYSGMMRFFFYGLEGSYVASNVYIMIGVPKSTSLFNFSKSYARGVNEPDPAPLLTYSPYWDFNNEQKLQLGYNSGTWYGMEFECAYDPAINNNSHFLFQAMISGANISTIEGNAETTGKIEGSITATSSNSPSLSLDFSHKNSVSTKIDNSITYVGKEIDSKAAQNNSFFVNIKKNIFGENMAENAMKMILSQGGSVAVKQLGKLFNSMMGGGSPQSSIIEMDLRADTKIELTSTTHVPGWAINGFPVIGSMGTNSLYNKPIGVWNLRKTPEVVVNIMQYYNNFHDEDTHCEIYVEYPQYSSSDIILNPEIENIFDIKNFDYNIVTKSYNVLISPSSVLKPYAYINGAEWYLFPFDVIEEEGRPFLSHKAEWASEFLFHVTFDLVSKTNPSEVYSYSKYFNVNGKEGWLEEIVTYD